MAGFLLSTYIKKYYVILLYFFLMEDFKQRRIKFNLYLENEKIKLPETTLDYTCPCCGFPTLNERGGYDICILCKWEDDGQDDINADEVLGGPNESFSLTEARDNFQKNLCYDGEKSRCHETPYIEIKNELIKLFYQLLDENAPRNEIIEKIDNCFREYHVILLEKIRKNKEKSN